MTDVKEAFDEMNHDVRQAVDVNIDFDDNTKKTSESSNDKENKQKPEQTEEKGSLKDE